MNWHELFPFLRPRRKAEETPEQPQATQPLPNKPAGESLPAASSVEAQTGDSSAVPLARLDAPDESADPTPSADPTAADPTPAREPGRGVITGCDLSALDSLTRPFAADPFRRLRPPLSEDAARLSLELANMAYTLELEPWVEAGWDDFAIQIDDSLQSGITHGASASGDTMRGIISALKLYRSKAALKDNGPLMQVLGTLRQRERSDNVKAVCMMHPLPDGRWLLANGFMGTGKRVSDWITNFRFTTEEGFHKGFHQLCTCFEQGAESIVFPRAAAALELDKLTLGEVLMELRSPSSRFRLWMAGHSQGGAVMQVFAHRLITQWGVLPQNLVGYGFASPTVATARLVHDPAAYPLYHILNSDDMVPRMGALLHLGLCLSYRSDDALRDACYDLSAQPEDIADRELFRPFQREMTDTPTILVYGTAFLQCVAEEKGEEGLNSLLGRWRVIAAVDRVLNAAGGKAMDLFARMIENAQNGHIALTGKPMDERRLAALRERMRPIVRELPFRRLVNALLSYCVPPHLLMRDNRKVEGAYAYIVRTGMRQLEPFLWVNQPSSPPVRRYGDAAVLWGMAQAAGVARRKRPAPAPRGKLRLSLTAGRRARG